MHCTHSVTWRATAGAWTGPTCLCCPQADELQGTDLPMAHGTAVDTAAETAADAAADAARPADSLHHPPGGPSTSDAPSQSDPPLDSALRPPSSMATPTQAFSGNAHTTDSDQQAGVSALQGANPTAERSSMESGSADSSGSSSSSSGYTTDIDWDSDAGSGNPEGQEANTTDTPSTHGCKDEQSKPYVMLAVKLRSGRVG